MKKVFEYMDKNGDGRLSREELIDGYTNLYGATDVEEEVDRIMSNVDIDQNGYIDYSGIYIKYIEIIYIYIYRICTGYTEQ